jgi:glucoamylase
VWAHAEYLKLLRSVFDGRVFDKIDAVEKRYANGRERINLEVFKLRRPVKTIRAGYRLRIIAQHHFRALWTVDDWQTVTTIDSATVGHAGSFADIPTTPKQTGKVSFTLFWPMENRWEGHNFDVAIEAAG